MGEHDRDGILLNPGMTNKFYLTSGLCLKTPSSGPRASVFSSGKDGEAGDVGFIVDGAGCRQTGNKPLEASMGFSDRARYFSCRLLSFSDTIDRTFSRWKSWILEDEAQIHILLEFDDGSGDCRGPESLDVG